MSKFNYRRLVPHTYEEVKEHVLYRDVSYITKRTFPGGEVKMSVKRGVTPANEEEAEKLKRNKELKREVFNWKDSGTAELEKIASLADLFNFKSINEAYDLAADKLKVKFFNYKSMHVALARSKKEMIDLLRCNAFEWFCVVTFNKTSVFDRKDPEETRRVFRKWLNHFRQDCPQVFYLVVPEFHKKGGLHFHLLLGNVTAEELKLVDSGKTVKKGVCKGDPIYNITRWKNGYSTATRIRDVNACKWYIMKYLRKQHADPRFVGKQRYLVSRNVVRPEKEKFTLDAEVEIEQELERFYDLVYRDEKKRYTVFESPDMHKLM